MLKNIVGGVITTVLATVLLWVFGFQERKKDAPAPATTQATAPAELVSAKEPREEAPKPPVPFQVRVYESLDPGIAREDVTVNLGGVIQGMTLTPDRPCQYLLFTAPAEGAYVYALALTTYEYNMYQQLYTTTGQNSAWITTTRSAPLLLVHFNAPNMYGIRAVKLDSIDEPPC